MKTTFKLLMIAIFIMNIQKSKAQDTDSLEILQVYETWEETVLNKQATDHLQLYLYNQAPVYIIKKNEDGPSFWGAYNASQFANSFSQPGDFQLDISDIHVIADDNFAITNAHFDEYINNDFTAFGRDMFGYIRTSEGWKLLFLHNTVVLENDENDYTEPFELSNTVEQELEDFQRHFNNRNGDSIKQMFVSQNNQAISFTGEIDANHQYFEHRITSFAIDITQLEEGVEINFQNIEIHYIDHYLASVFCDYSINSNGETIEEGRAWMSMLGEMQNGWRLSSFIRDYSEGQVTALPNQKKKRQ